MSRDVAKGDALFIRLMPKASEDERGAAKERLQALMHVLLRAEERRNAYHGDGAIRTNGPSAVKSDSSSNQV